MGSRSEESRGKKEKDRVLYTSVRMCVASMSKKRKEK